MYWEEDYYRFNINLETENFIRYGNFSCYMYKLLNDYGHDHGQVNYSSCKYSLLKVGLFNPSVEMITYHLYPFADLDNTKYQEFYKKSLEEREKFITVIIEYVNEAEYLDDPSFADLMEQADYDNGLLLKIETNEDEN